MKNCIGCGAQVFGKHLSKRKYCSNKCRLEKLKKENQKINPISGLCSGIVGTIAELVVSSDLLGKGYSVFRALSPSCNCDLIILDAEKNLKRVEVTTGYYSLWKNKIFHHKKKCKSLNKFDILAIYMKDGKIIYEPKLE